MNAGIWSVFEEEGVQEGVIYSRQWVMGGRMKYILFPLDELVSRSLLVGKHQQSALSVLESLRCLELHSLLIYLPACLELNWNPQLPVRGCGNEKRVLKGSLGHRHKLLLKAFSLLVRVRPSLSSRTVSISQGRLLCIRRRTPALPFTAEDPTIIPTQSLHIHAKLAFGRCVSWSISMSVFRSFRWRRIAIHLFGERSPLTFQDTTLIGCWAMGEGCLVWKLGVVWGSSKCWDEWVTRVSLEDQGVSGRWSCLSRCKLSNIPSKACTSLFFHTCNKCQRTALSGNAAAHTRRQWNKAPSVICKRGKWTVEVNMKERVSSRCLLLGYVGLLEQPNVKV